MASSGSDMHGNKWHRVCNSLQEPQPLPTLPSDVIPEILCRLPVKFILQFRCVCKSWNSLISDPKFIKKQLRVSTTQNLHFLDYSPDLRKYILTSYPLDSIFTNITSNFTQSDWPYANFYSFIGSCKGIVCFAEDEYTGSLVISWNPSTRKFKELPLFEKPTTGPTLMTFGFGYDSSKDNYKVVVVFSYLDHDKDNVDDSFFNKTQVKVHTLGTNIWRTVQEYPFGGLIVPVAKGGFVSGTINWLFSKEEFWEWPRFIISFDLATESYQKISPPNLEGVDVCDLSALSVLKDCLCVTTYGNDVWLMKEYGNKESWTKLFTIPNMRDPSKPKVYVNAKVIYVFEDDQVLLELYDFDLNLVLYNPRSGAWKATNFKLVPEVCVESLISPSSLC